MSLFWASMFTSHEELLLYLHLNGRGEAFSPDEDCEPRLLARSFEFLSSWRVYL
jgi:hypothetical protein